MTSEGSGRADRTGTVIGMGLAAVVILAVIVLALSKINFGPTYLDEVDGYEDAYDAADRECAVGLYDGRYESRFTDEFVRCVDEHVRRDLGVGRDVLTR